MGIRNFVALTALAAGLATSPALAQDEPAQTFTMDGGWALDVGDDYCRLAATFVSGDDGLALALEKNRADNFARLMLISDSIRTYRGTEEIGYSYLPANDARSARFLRSEAESGAYFNLGAIIFGPNPFAQVIGGGPGGADSGNSDAPFVLPPYDRAAEEAFASTITAIELRAGLLSPVRINTGNLSAPIKALQTCTDDLLLYWGLDYEKHQTMTRRAAPKGMAYEWLSSGTIGFGDFALLGGGNNAVRVMVDAAGKPTECQVHWASLSERTNSRICSAIMEKGEFEPALDADGNAMASYWMVDPIFGLVRPFGR